MMMKFLLLKHRYNYFLAKTESIALETVAAALQANQIDFVYYDENFLRGGFRKLKKTIAKNNVTHLGITTNPNDIDETLVVARKLKKDFPNLFVILGGNNAELYYNLYFDDAVDLIYHDNGLKTFDTLLKAHFSSDAIKNAKGVCYKEEGKWVVNEKGEAISEFEFEALRLTDYKKTYLYSKGNYALVKGSWSCPHKCLFCNCRRMNNGKYTQRNLDNLISEIERIKCKQIWIVDDDFFADKKRAIEFCNTVIDRKIEKEYYAYARADFVCENPDILPLARKAGFRNLNIGFEAVNDKILEHFEKFTTKKMNETCVKYLSENGINCVGSFILTPDFTRKDFKDLKNFVKEYRIHDTIFAPLMLFSMYENENAQRIKSKRINEKHINFKPLNMTKLEYSFRFYMLYVRFFLIQWSRKIKLK